MRTETKNVFKKGILILFSIFFYVNIAVAQEPTIATCDGDQSICLITDSYDICVEITVDPAFPFVIDSFLIDFDDGTIVFVPGSNNPPTIQHLYDFSDIFNMDLCFEEKTVRLYTYYTDNGVVGNVSTATFPAFFNPPNAVFSLNPSTACIGQEVSFSNNSFPTCSLTSFWDYGDGTTGSDPFHTYSVPGSYQVTLTVDNSCENPDMVTEILEVIGPANAIVIPEPGYIDFTSPQPILICLNDDMPTFEIPLNGDSLSTTENSYTWSSLNGYPNASWILDPPNPNDPTPNVPDPIIYFTDTGFVQVILMVDNICQIPSYDTITFQINSGISLVSQNQPDVCDTLDYQPNPFNPNATYTINGVVQDNDDFPVPLGSGEYIVQCFLANICGNQTTIDEFEVLEPINANILSPNDTTLCPGTEPILLLATPPDGSWSGSNNLITSPTGDSIWYNPFPGEIAILIYSPPSPSPLLNCGTPDTITITVEDGGFFFNDYLKCDVSENFLLEATPTPDIWWSTDCPPCVVNDSFIVSEMVASGLSSVIVMFENTITGICPSSGSLTVELHNPEANFVMDDTGCSNFSIPADGTASIANQPLMWMVDGVLDNAGPPFTLSAGMHTIQLIAKYGECSDTTELPITVIDPPPVLNFTATPLVGCADLEVDLMVVDTQISGVTYNWYLDGMLFSSDYDPANIILEQGLTDTTYTISLGSGNNCGDETATQVITVYPKPIVNFGTNKPEYCSGDTIYFGNASHGNPNSYLWDFGFGNTSTLENPPYIILFTGDSPTTYPITLMGFNDCGSDTLTKFITINPTDVNAFFNTSLTTACVGEPICFESFSTFGAGIIFDFGDGNTTTSSNPCHTYTSPGIYEVSLKAFGCGFDSIFTMVEILPLPLVDIALTNSIYCPNEIISFSSVASTIVDCFWDFGNNNTSTTCSPQFSYDTPGTYQVKLTGLSIDSCWSQDSMLITIVENPEAQFTLGTDTICEGNTISFINTSIGATSCHWDFGDGNFSTDCSPTHTYAVAGNYTATLTVENFSDCDDFQSQLVVVTAQPVPDFTFVLNQDCSPVTATFFNQSTNAQSYEWTFGNGDTSTQTNPTVVYNTGGSFPIQLIATNIFCSRSTDSVANIIQTPIPQILLPTGEEGCAPVTISFSANVQALDPLDYVWDFGDNTFSFNENEAHPYTEPGVYEVKLVVSTQTDMVCKDSVIETITIYEPVLISDAITDILCYGDDTGRIDLTIESGTAPFAFDWSNGTVLEDAEMLIAGQYDLTIIDANGCTLGETFQISQPPPIIASTLDSSLVTCYGGDDGALCIEVSGGVANYNLIWDNGVVGDCIENVSAGDYMVSVTDANNCLIAFPFEVFENPEIVLLDSVVNVSCFGADDGLILLNSITGGFSDFYNNTLSGPVNYDGGDSFADLLPGDYHLIVQDLEGCTFEKDYTIGEPDSLWMNIVEDSLYLLMGDSIRIPVAHNAGQPIFNWRPATGLNCYDCEDPWAMPLKTTAYSVSMTDENGCTAMERVTIVVDPNRNFFIPNTFTPNGDGRNDLFRIRSRIASIKQVNVFRIYDRWGELVFEATNFRPQEENDQNAWDGTFRGKELTTENFSFYVEVLYLDGVTESAEGTVALIR